MPVANSFRMVPISVRLRSAPSQQDTSWAGAPVPHGRQQAAEGGRHGRIDTRATASCRSTLECARRDSNTRPSITPNERASGRNSPDLHHHEHLKRKAGLPGFARNRVPADERFRHLRAVGLDDRLGDAGMAPVGRLGIGEDDRLCRAGSSGQCSWTARFSASKPRARPATPRGSNPPRAAVCSSAEALCSLGPQVAETSAARNLELAGSEARETACGSGSVPTRRRCNGSRVSAPMKRPAVGPMHSSAGMPTTPRADVWIVAEALVSCRAGLGAKAIARRWAAERGYGVVRRAVKTSSPIG
jgi:hypothetical protein